VFSSLVTICASDLSSFYFEAIKDRVYSDAKSSNSRRSAQTVLFHYLIHLTKSISPLTPHLADDIFENTPSHLRSYFLSPTSAINVEGDQLQSVFQTGWYVDDLPADWKNTSLETKWNCIRHIKNNVNKHLEELREKDQIKASTEASVTIGLPATSQEYLWLSELSLNELALSFGVSVVNLSETEIPFITAQKVSEFSKCTRCWMFTAPLQPEPQATHSACLCSVCFFHLNFVKAALTLWYIKNNNFLFSSGALK
jgi:isoleucyl-tRNA synthetase